MSTTQSPQKTQWLPLIICIAIPLAIGVTASFFTDADSAWYRGLNKPSFNPPAWLFAPVWTILYIMMGVASYLIWEKRDESVAYLKARSLYVMQLLFNFGWSFIFFRGQNVLGGMVIIVFLLALIITCIVHFKKINKTAAWLMVPYLLWVTFATLLNYTIITLN
ncbi:MAG: tryptophan-rich sensory protein [Sphingobacteriaceae bacterium]|nr:MAG: tryptophan-rich sensory protein [Sphingobacteriaceae bacterium]